MLDREAHHPCIHHRESRGGSSPSQVGVGQLSGEPGWPLSVCTAQDYWKPPLEVPTITQWLWPGPGSDRWNQNTATSLLRDEHALMRRHTHPALRAPFVQADSGAHVDTGLQAHWQGPFSWGTGTLSPAQSCLPTARVTRDFPNPNQCVEFQNNKARIQKRKF